ncbi:VOC family protein [Oryzibacter oryziterrae]|uniref:VOC family protein n=1 Tax=Oryzibacter oryziterrae TaxID=2766474 RepID=UPI001F29C74B|nr:VOC family protein [Oryzibacter oryziterrae]
MHHLSNWIEIPVTDMARARRFYEALTGAELTEFDFGPFRYAMFGTQDRFNAGALVKGEGYDPSPAGPVIYLDASGRIDELAVRLTQLGATILMPKTFLSDEAGEVVLFLDSEGNRLGLQAPVARAKDAPVDDATMQAQLGSAKPAIAFVLTRGPAHDDPATAPMQWEHARNMFTLMRDGTLSHVSAFMDGTDLLGYGILTVATPAEADAILADDPGVLSGRLSYRLLTAVAFDAGNVAHRL